MTATPPILERIALTIVGRLATVKLANGYQQDLAAVIRPQRLGDYQPGNLEAVMVQGDETLDEDNSTEGNPRGICRLQPFLIALYAVTSERDPRPIETIVNTLRADCEKALTPGDDWQTLADDGTPLSLNAWFGEASNMDSIDGAFAGVILEFVVQYRVAQNNPYQLA